MRYLTPRARRVLALLEGLEEYTEDRESLGRDELESPAGFAPTYRRCAVCLGTGHASPKDPLGRNRCPECDGEGQIRVRTQGEIDPYEIGTKGAATVERPRTMTGREIDHELARLRADEYTRRGITAHERYAWERRRRRMEQEGDYRLVALALEQLRDEEPEAYRAARRREAWGLERLAGFVPGSVRVPDDVYGRITQSLVDDAFDLRDRGVTAETSASLLAVKPSRVNWLLRQKRTPKPKTSPSSGAGMLIEKGRSSGHPTSRSGSRRA